VGMALKTDDNSKLLGFKIPGNYCCVPLCDGRGGHKITKEKVCRKHFKASDYRPENFSGKW